MLPLGPPSSLGIARPAVLQLLLLPVPPVIRCRAPILLQPCCCRGYRWAPGSSDADLDPPAALLLLLPLLPLLWPPGPRIIRC